tara:strand:+ start:252 stop:575 length:324 start_codon:yes stop_codon:yes gene_type:complete
MNKYITLIFIFVITLSLTSCGGTRGFLTNAKKPGGDEFLVEKKQPLTMPPNFEDIPVPMSEEQEEIGEQETSEAEITEMLKELEGESNQSSEEISGNLENSILKKIK